LQVGVSIFAGYSGFLGDPWPAADLFICFCGFFLIARVYASSKNRCTMWRCGLLLYHGHKLGFHKNFAGFFVGELRKSTKKVQTKEERRAREVE
jgi:hypothetical protein